MRKKKGSILIEVIASIMILSFGLLFILSVYQKLIREYELRKTEEKVDRCINMIIKEIKYNVHNDDLEEIFSKSNALRIKYDENMCEIMLNTDFKELESGNDIIIEKNGSDEKRTYYTIQTDINKEKINIDRKYEFYKSWWMDEI